jgi:hypothetical protein
MGTQPRSAEVMGSGMFDATVRELVDHGAAHLTGPWTDTDAAWSVALAVFSAINDIDRIDGTLPDLTVVGEYLVPPSSADQRSFQPLHLDFGVPLVANQPVDIARFTALFVDPTHVSSGALTRVVVLADLFAYRTWPEREVIAERLVSTVDENRSVEGILGRIIDIADQRRDLPAPETPEFLCGMEFGSLTAEQAFFAAADVDLADVERPICVAPGGLLLLDNLRTAHGRIGRPRP